MERYYGLCTTTDIVSPNATEEVFFRPGIICDVKQISFIITKAGIILGWPLLLRGVSWFCLVGRMPPRTCIMLAGLGHNFHVRLGCSPA